METNRGVSLLRVFKFVVVSMKRACWRPGSNSISELALEFGQTKVTWHIVLQTCSGHVLSSGFIYVEQVLLAVIYPADISA